MSELTKEQIARHVEAVESFFKKTEGDCQRCGHLYYSPDTIIADYRQRAAEWEDEARKLREENARLKAIIAKQLVEEDGLGMEVTYVAVLKEKLGETQLHHDRSMKRLEHENARLRTALKRYTYCPHVGVACAAECEKTASEALGGNVADK